MSFVKAKRDSPLHRYGIGKLVEDGAEATVSFFVSPAEACVEHIIPKDDLEDVLLMRHERVFFQDENSNWRVGRFEDYFGENTLLLALPNRENGHLHIDDCFVRSDLSIDDPMGLLACRSTETSFFHQRRATLLRALAEQRSAYRGLTGLASSNIELFKHQFLVARHILTDPVQRFLLADEVGLGKTIEAGIVIRQHLLDQRQDASVIVLAPENLVDQWNSELDHLFHLSEDDVEIFSHGDVALLPEDMNLSLLVVDEAHQIAANAYDPDHAHDTFDPIRELASRARGVLLLSATPVLHNEASYLAMLHLLDPQAHRLDDLDQFHALLEKRKIVGKAVRALRDDAFDFVLEPLLGDLDSLARSNERLSEAIANVRNVLADDQAPDRNFHIATLRTELQEGFRLDRRVLRTRRSSEDVAADLPPRLSAQWNLEDPIRAKCYEWLDVWRFEARNHPEAADEFPRALDRLLEHPNLLCEYVEERCQALEAQQDLEFFDNELAWHDQNRLKPISMEEDPRIDALRELLVENREKYIVFISSSDIAAKAAECLAGTLEVYYLDPAQGCEPALAGFVAAKGPAALICDRAGEEGLNLQRLGSERLVHFDLPLNPNRIEQRIGRLDRLGGRAGSVRNIIPALQIDSSIPNYESAWVDCLSETIKIFSASSATLQHPLDAGMNEMRPRLLENGVEAIRDLQSKWGAPTGDLSFDRELEELANQDVFDQIELMESGADELYEELEEYEYASVGEESRSDALKREVRGWAKEVLNFREHGRDPGEIEFEYHSRKTLLPANRFLELFEPSFSRRERYGVSTGWLQTNRRLAQESGTPILRVGHPLLENLIELMRRDDRGHAFATWRNLEGYSRRPEEARLFFRFDFSVEAELSSALAAARSAGKDRSALVRRADDALPPSFHTLWIDTAGSLVTAADLLEDLEAPYDKRTDVRIRTHRWDVVDSFGIYADWAKTCRNAREAAHDRFPEVANLDEMLANAHDRLTQRWTEIERQLKARIASLPDATTDRQALESEAVIFEQLTVAIEKPAIRFDAVGAVFLSGDPLPVD